MLYTRAGDDGTTKRFGCNQRLSKSSAIAEALGALDEITSFLGLCAVRAREEKRTLSVGGKTVTLAEVVREMQENLFTIQAEVAGAEKKITAAKITAIEGITDTIEQLLPPITSFSVPGGTELSSLFDIARTIARRAERRVVQVTEEGEASVGKNTLAYLNRLSSILFALARLINHQSGITEEHPQYR
jgi:cob(I)alamin adenosyltransferase